MTNPPDSYSEDPYSSGFSARDSQAPEALAGDPGATGAGAAPPATGQPPSAPPPWPGTGPFPAQAFDAGVNTDGYYAAGPDFAAPGQFGPGQFGPGLSMPGQPMPGPGTPGQNPASPAWPTGPYLQPTQAPAEPWRTYQPYPSDNYYDPAVDARPLEDPFRPPEGAYGQVEGYSPYAAPPAPVYPSYGAPLAPGAIPRPRVGLIRAFQLMFKNGLNFSGRASLSEYWMAVLSIGLVTVLWFISMMLTGIVSYEILGVSTDAPVFLMAMAGLAFAAVSTIPAIALQVRRLHDVNLNGGFWFVNLLPFGPIVMCVLLAQASKPEAGHFDDPSRLPKTD
jgi:uncharacterized membrane protein YhaH (DUF805 family)